MRKTNLAALAQTDGWKELIQIQRDRRDRHVKEIANKILNGDPIDPLHVAHIRGFWKGMGWILAHPESSEAELRKLAEELE